MEAVAESLTVNGQYRPIVVTTDGTILAGNHTYAAALSLGWDRIAAVTVDVAPESPEALRIMLADNRTADLGGYDDALLLDLLRDLDTLEGSGYVEDDVAESRLQRDAAWELWEQVAELRLSSRGKVVLIMTRWHADDLAGRLLARAPQEWRVVSVPAISDGADDPLGRPEGVELQSVQRRAPRCPTASHGRTSRGRCPGSCSGKGPGSRTPGSSPPSRTAAPSSTCT